MFFRRRYYYDPYGYRRSSNFIVGLIIAVILIGIVLTALFYIGSIVFMIACGIGLLIGLVYAIIIYVKAMIEAGRRVFASSGRKFTFKQYFRFLIETSKIAFMDNLAASKKSYYKSTGHKLLSPKKWAWLIACVATTVFGTMLLLACIAVHALIAIWLFTVALSVIFLVLTIPTVIYSLFTVCPEFVKTVSNYNPWKIRLRRSGARHYSGEYFSRLIEIVRTVWRDNLALMRSNISKSRAFGFLNIKKYVLLFSPCVIIAAELVMILLMFIIFGVSYLPLLLINCFKKK